MRTTLTLDDDVAARLVSAARKSGRSFKSVVNETLRVGLERAPGTPAKAFRVRPRSLGLRDGLDYANVNELLDRAEGDNRR
jgi:hypothetical protein